jgi:GTP:adenosylcobinamide-phosphate guanylyltransferase
MPYRSDKGSAKTDVPYVGYVKGMNIQVSTEGPALSVSADLSNVRTAEEDEKFASPKDSNPLYTNVNAKPV